MNGIAKRGFAYAEAVHYIGCSRRHFDKRIKPLLPEPTAMGTRKVWDIVDLDRAFEEYRERNGRPDDQGEKKWVDQKPRAPSGGKTAGESTRYGTVTEFRKVASEIKAQRRTG